jgi:LacI family transcriptional regulator
LNYYPNLHARSLAGGKTNSLGMIVSNICNPFFVDIFVAMEAAARERGYEVLLEHTDYKPSQLVAHVRSMIGRRVAGLALVVSEMDEAVGRRQRPPRSLLRRRRPGAEDHQHSDPV